MRAAIILMLLLCVASMADSFIESVIDRLNWTDLITMGIVVFAALLIYTVNNAQTRGR
ncbi:hypothetical protein [Dyadobacter psychrophilus]|uniref:Uncharacterized protein n=1 Tax=Dyadobacter psychrophilus TaxID=651661 RepID=A0A1T5BYL6_9BACT|nr:hypothetical protein [Dyadobacter psychrophilus]SKB51970.1 hypothetical protein SAMN05660293_00695 [Dyadobacter psychrophilus]